MSFSDPDIFGVLGGGEVLEGGERTVMPTYGFALARFLCIMAKFVCIMTNLIHSMAKFVYTYGTYAK